MKNLGEITAYGYSGGLLSIETPSGGLEIQVVNPRTFRIKVLTGQVLPDCSDYAVPVEPLPTPFSVSDKGHELEIDTGEAKLLISKSPLRLKFFDRSGQLISEEDYGLGTMIEGPEITCYRTLQPGERFMGLGEKTGSLDRAGKQYRNWNTDAYSYGVETDPLYVSCPFFMGIAHGSMYGIFLNNTSETVFNFGAANDRFSFFQSKTGTFEYYFFTGADPASILLDYTALTGRTPLPPLWSLGYQQCRYSYRSSDDVLRIAKTFRQKGIPADVMYLDIHYMQEYKVFTWQKDEFPEPQTLISELRELNFRVVPILDPGIKVEDGYHVVESGIEGDVFLKYPDGEKYRGAAWPGWCYFPDFSRELTQEWWAESMQNLAKMGITGFWNDMNEPAAWGHHTPNILEFDNKGRGGNHKLLRNIYGMEMTRATKAGGQKTHPDRRIFILTRAGFSGSQRHAAIWTGDNFANDEHLLLGCRLLNSMGLSGFAFTGNDVGGFIADATPALFMRWIAIGAFQGLMRGHSMINSRDAEPWTFGEEAEQVALNFIRLRYALMPTLYSLYYESSLTGLPITRSLAFYYFQDWKIFQNGFDNQFLFGRDLLVCPVISSARFTKVYLPEGTWYNFWNDDRLQGSREFLLEVPGDQIPVFARAGGLLITDPNVSDFARTDPGELALHAYLGGSGSLLYYTDDGESHAHAAGIFATWQISLSANELRIEKQHTGFESNAKSLRVFLHGLVGESVKLDGNAVEIVRENFRFLEKIPNFDPFEAYPDYSKVVENLAFVNVSLENSNVLLKF